MSDLDLIFDTKLVKVSPISSCKPKQPKNKRVLPPSPPAIQSSRGQSASESEAGSDPTSHFKLWEP